MAQASNLNIFQHLVRQWDGLHPYNAAQVLRIAGRADLDQLSRHWQASIAAMGLGKLELNGRRFAYQDLNGDASIYRVRELPPTQSLEKLISEELNRPFEDGNSFPFRPFVINGPDSHYVGVVYQHWIADSVSIRLLLKEWFVRQYDPSAARKSPVHIPRGGYWRFFSPDRAKWRLGEGFLSSVRWSSRFKRVRRIEAPEFKDLRVKFSLHATPEGWIDRVYASSKRMGVTLNDLFLAAIAEACDQIVPVVYTPKRQDLALGTIVDLRPHSHEDLSDTFGMFLGFTSVVCRPGDFSAFDRLLRRVSTQTTMHKETGVPQASPIRMMAGLLAGKLLTRDDALTFYRKRVPLAGGISNVNMTKSWAQKYHPAPLLDYVRVSPTGPMMPLVFTTTTLGKHFHFGLTRRASIISDDNAKALADSFINRLSQIADTK